MKEKSDFSINIKLDIYTYLSLIELENFKLILI
jgi:hypothetical protein